MTRACENCGSTIGVTTVAYSRAGERVAQPLCDSCKATLLGRRRTRSREHAARTRRRGLSRTLADGGPIAYVGVGLFVLGLALVPILVLVSLLTR